MGNQQRELRSCDIQNNKRSRSNIEQVILRNLSLSNRDLSEQVGLTIGQVRHFLRRQNIIRTSEQLEQIYLRCGQRELGKNNPNWRGGISKDFARYKRIQMERYPDRVNARQLAGKALKAGKIKKLDHCELCDSKDDLHLHHEDYSRPLDVRTACRKCNEKLKHCEWSELVDWYSHKLVI